VQSDNFRLGTQDGTEVFVYRWFPEDGAGLKAVVQISHGMAEHAGRYGDFAAALVEAGYAVYANDHRGHGKAAGSLEKVGYLADDNGWNLLVDDMHRLTCSIKERHPDVPVFLLGHSMGSILSRNYIFLHAKDVSGVILSGTGGDPGLLGKIGLLIAKWEIRRKGKRAQSPLLAKLSFGNFNNAFKPNRTDFDWLSRDNAQVDRYVEDPFCGGVFTAGFFYDLLTGLAGANKSDNIKGIPPDLPIYLLSGEKDPVGKDKKGVLQVYNAYKNAGLEDVKCQFYKDGRHEMLNETNREEVYKDIIDWLDAHA